MAKDIDKILSLMRKSSKDGDMKGKGDGGEEAVLQIVLQLQNQIGGQVYHSYKYPYQSDRSGKVYTGNVILEDGKLVEYTDSKRGLFDEIDILYVTDYRVFAIEVKSYKATIDITDTWVNKNSTPVSKSPILQAEKHARHLYHAISPVLPDGDPNYIIPLCVFVDKCTIKDSRSISNSYYIPVYTLNTCKSGLLERNTPLSYNIDLEAMKHKLNEVCNSVARKYI